MNDTFTPPNDKELSMSDRHRFGRMLPAYGGEIVYQLSLTFLLLVFFSFNMDHTEAFSFQGLFGWDKLAFFANYFAAAMIINYVLLPYLYDRKHILLFALSVILLITLVVLVDEYFLEKIFFPDTRGLYFPGFFYTMVETLPIIIIMVAFKIGWHYDKKRREVEQLKNLVKENEIRFLKSQINPHFLFNNLNNIYAYALNASPQTPEIILDLSAVLRYMLYECRDEFVSLHRELDHLKRYIRLFELQLGRRGSMTLTESISGEAYYIPPLILMVFVENAFKHSTGTLPEGIAVTIHLQVTETGKLAFSCVNNYASEYQAKPSAGGIGLCNVVKRLDLLYPKAYELNVNNHGSRYSVSLELPLRRHHYA